MDHYNPAEPWLAKALDDMGSAKVLLREGFIANSCYHSQQAGEKLLKAYLSLHEEEPAWTHNLGQLCKDCMEYDSEFETIADDASDLTEYATHTRYPGDDSFSERHAEDAIEKVRLIYEFALPRIRALEQALDQSGPTMQM